MTIGREGACDGICISPGAIKDDNKTRHCHDPALNEHLQWARLRADHLLDSVRLTFIVTLQVRYHPHSADVETGT